MEDSRKRRTARLYFHAFFFLDPRDFPHQQAAKLLSPVYVFAVFDRQFLVKAKETITRFCPLQLFLGGPVAFLLLGFGDKGGQLAVRSSHIDKPDRCHDSGSGLKANF